MSAFVAVLVVLGAVGVVRRERALANAIDLTTAQDCPAPPQTIDIPAKPQCVMGGTSHLIVGTTQPCACRAEGPHVPLNFIRQGSYAEYKVVSCVVGGPALVLKRNLALRYVPAGRTAFVRMRPGDEGCRMLPSSRALSEGRAEGLLDRVRWSQIRLKPIPPMPARKTQP